VGLLNTINGYFKNHLPILVDRDTSEKNATDASLDRYGIIHIHEDHFFPETYEFYKCLLHEFIHLDRFKTSGSVYGRRKPMPGKNLSYDLRQRLEDEINRECDLLIEQKSLVFRLLKDSLKSAKYIVEEMH